MTWEEFVEMYPGTTRESYAEYLAYEEKHAVGLARTRAEIARQAALLPPGAAYEVTYTGSDVRVSQEGWLNRYWIDGEECGNTDATLAVLRGQKNVRMPLHGSPDGQEYDGRSAEKQAVSWLIDDDWQHPRDAEIRIALNEYRRRK